MSTMSQEMEPELLNTTEAVTSSCTDAGPEWPQTPLSRIESTLFGILLATSAGLATLGNAMVLYLIYRFRVLRTRFSYLLLSMSFGDILMSSCAQMVSTSTLKGQWLYGKLGCNLYGFISTLTVMVSIGCLVSIAIWRYLSVRSLQSGYKIYRISKKAIVINLTCIWFSSFIFAVSPLLGWSRYILEKNMVSCAFDYLSIHWQSRSYALVMIIWGFFLPVIAMTICYSLLTCLLCRHRRDINRQLKAHAIALTLVTKRKQIKNNLKASYIGGLCVFLFLVSWLPYGTISIMSLFNHGRNMKSYVVTIACFLAKVVTLINPLVYAFCHQNYRNQLWLLFRRRPVQGNVFRRLDIMQRDTSV